MKQYLTNLLPRLQQFSKTLDHLENFVDKPWILIDDDGNRHTYVFQRDKSLVMSLNGKAQVGKWDYIKAANSLLLDRTTDKLLLNSAFVEKGLMILRMDGSPDRPWILANEKEIPDLDIQRYLTALTIRNYNLKTVAYNGKKYYYSYTQEIGMQVGSLIYDENFKRVSDSFTLTGGKWKYNVDQGKVVSYYFESAVVSDQGPIVICTSSMYLSIGESVLKNGSPAPDGVYKLAKHDLYDALKVSAGKISALKEKKSHSSTIVILIILGVIGGIIGYTMYNN